MFSEIPKKKIIKKGKYKKCKLPNMEITRNGNQQKQKMWNNKDGIGAYIINKWFEWILSKME